MKEKTKERLILLIKDLILLFLCLLLLFYLFKEPKISEDKNLQSIEITEIIEEESPKRKPFIGILVLFDPEKRYLIYRAADSIQCYAHIHDYEMIFLNETHKECDQKDLFFRRYCIVAQVLPKYDYLLYLDNDIGVVNPLRRIEDFIDPESDITFYERYFNQEIMSGSLLLKNTLFARNFIKGLANYKFKEQKLFDSGSGALSMYLISRIFHDSPEEYANCVKVYEKATNYEDLQVFQACIKTVIGVQERFSRFRILRKGSGWARDNWITNSLWSPESDFMMHLWKQPYVRTIRKSDLPIIPRHDQQNQGWYDPIKGNLIYDLCLPGNTTWKYDLNLISTTEKVEKALEEYRAKMTREHYKRIARIYQMLK